MVAVQVVLVHPEIAGNSGSIIRLCANVGAALHLVEPLGYTLEDRLLRRAGLDYHDLASVTVHPTIEACASMIAGRRTFAFTAKATTRYTDIAFADDDVFVFGPESAGLTALQIAAFTPADLVTIPMRPNNRSLNLANSVSIVLYEAWRQHGFPGSADTSTPRPDSEPARRS
jgi:tRNA (cytidine/uridine-2'-O-)-methyltransferase